MVHLLSPSLGIAALVVPLTFSAHADITGKARVIDGDTIEIAGERIRLHGIDAPEAKQTCQDNNGGEWRCGQEATLALATIVGDQLITCRGDVRGKYGRLIAVCSVGLIDLNVLISICAFVSFFAQLIFLYNFLYSAFKGPKTPKNPWRSNTLEWTAPVEHFHGNWPGEIPEVHRWPYDYSKPGAEEDFIPQNVPLEQGELDEGH